MEIKILGLNFDVEFKDFVSDLLSEDSVGMSNLPQQKIYVSINQTKDQQIQTLIHEIIEIIKDLNELDIKHSDICSIETGITSSLSGILKIKEKIEKD